MLLLVLSPKLLDFILSRQHIHESLHWLEINQRIQYKALSVTNETLNSDHRSHLRSILSFNHTHSIRAHLLWSHFTVLVAKSLSYPTVTERSFYTQTDSGILGPLKACWHFSPLRSSAAGVRIPRGWVWGGASPLLSRLEGLGGVVSSPSGVRGGARPPTILVHSGPKERRWWHLQ
jgi:hypothetical protein